MALVSGAAQQSVGASWLGRSDPDVTSRSELLKFVAGTELIQLGRA